MKRFGFAVHHIGKASLLETSATLVVTSALLVATRFATRNKCIGKATRRLIRGQSPTTGGEDLGRRSPPGDRKERNGPRVQRKRDTTFLVASLFLVARPGAPRVASLFLVRPGAPFVVSLMCRCFLRKCLFSSILVFLWC